MGRRSIVGLEVVWMGVRRKRGGGAVLSLTVSGK